MFFLVFSVSVTLLQFLILRFLPGLLGEEMAAEEAMWPDPPLEFDFLGSHVRWCLLGCEVMRDASGRAVIGGFDNAPGSLIYTGTDAEIRREIVSILDDAGTVGVGIGADCTIDMNLPVARMELARTVAKEYGSR